MKDEHGSWHGSDGSWGDQPLASGFMVVKGMEYSAEFSAGLFPWTDNYMAVYFTMTGLHGLHVLGGMVVIAYLLGPGAKMWETEPDSRQLGIWHHVCVGTKDMDAVWKTVKERGYEGTREPSIGRDGRWLLHLLDKHNTRTEVCH